MKLERITFFRLTARERNIAFLAVFIIIFCAIINFGIIPLSDRFKLFKKELIMAQLRLKEYRYLLANKKQLADFYAGFPLPGKAAGGRDTLSLTLKELENLSSEAGLRISEVRPLDTAIKKGEDKELSIELKAEGTAVAVARFLYNIEYSTQFMSVKRMDLNYKAPNVVEAVIVISRPA
jgi:hypothetical protein